VDRPGLLASHSCGGPVSVRIAVSGCVGDGVLGFAAGGVAVQVRGDSAIFDPLTAGFAGSAGLTNALVGRLDTWSACACGRAISQVNGSFVGSGGMKIYSKNRLPVGTAGFEPATP
jgi:hypothetical protein